MVNVIAKVRLASGRIGFFDEATRIHLSVSRPEASIHAGMNTANIKRAVQQKVLHLVAGSLEVGPKTVDRDMQIKSTVRHPETKKEVKEEVKTEPVKEEIIEAPKEEAKAEPVEEAKVEETPAEEVKEEAPKRKRTPRKAAEETKEEE